MCLVATWSVARNAVAKPFIATVITEEMKRSLINGLGQSVHREVASW